MIETYAPIIPIPHDNELELRIITPYDGPMLHDFVQENQRHLQRFQPQVATLGESVEAATKAVQSSIDLIETGDYLQYRLMRSNEMAGTITLFDREERMAKVGCYIGAKFIGRQFAPRASRALLEYARQPHVWNLSQAELHISDENVPSQHVAQRLGAQPTSYFGSEPTGHGDLWRSLRIWKLAL